MRVERASELTAVAGLFSDSLLVYFVETTSKTVRNFARITEINPLKTLGEMTAT